MTKNSKYYGLCETCEHDSTCMLRRSTQLKIIQCEEFSIQPVVGRGREVEVGTQIPDLAEEAQMGLCANCLHKLTCGFPNARQGVLQCEEYVLDEEGSIPPAKSEPSRSAA
jgi:hypothetical protein